MLIREHLLVDVMAVWTLEDTMQLVLVLDTLVHHAEVLLVRACCTTVMTSLIRVVTASSVVVRTRSDNVASTVTREVVLLILKNRW